MSRQPQVMVLQHVGCETLGTIEIALGHAGLSPQYRAPFAGDRVPTQPAGASGLIVMGGPMGVYEQDQYPHSRDECRLIEEALQQGLPVLGVCLGSQLLAHVLGARVYPGAGKEIGWYPVELSAVAQSDSLWQGVDSRFTAYHWHGDVFDLPAGCQRLAGSELTENQAFRHGGGAYGILFHMEVTAPLVEAMIVAFDEELCDAGTSAADSRAGSRLSAGIEQIGQTVFGRWAMTAAAGAGIN